MNHWEREKEKEEGEKQDRERIKEAPMLKCEMFMTTNFWETRLRIRVGS